ncbi:MAG: tetratricopeptide repeat protein [Gammaproteobacteria bacterium]|nr:tetratricopeptide repeat protein [Gammaproteobacteria bacterium]MCP5426912.1 tetratricopeptide repeat protein [Chromatiaceae bacterium]
MAGSVTQAALPVVGGNLRKLLRGVFLVFVVLAVNSLYLGAVTLYETLSGASYQDYFYLLMFLLHLLLGLILLPIFTVFGLLHQSRARQRTNRYAVRAGYLLFATGLLLLLSGLVLTRFGFMEINDARMRTLFYWIHVGTPFLALWLFVVHRLAGRAIDWRTGGVWGAAALTCALVLTVLQLNRAAPDPGHDWFTFAPALARVSSGSPQLPARHLMQDETCAECHGDIARQSAMSMHKFSSFNNPAYRFSVEETRAALMERDEKPDAARLCAVCHDQVPLFTGRFDDPGYDPDIDPGAQAGITCIGCHGITGISSSKGNGSYDFEDPQRYPFAFSDNGFLQAVNRQLIKAKPAFHKRTFLKPVHKSALFCSACHKVHLPYELNHYKWLRGQNHYDSFLLSGVSGHRVDSFYYPEQAVPNCAHCHMPLTPSTDPAARSRDSHGALSIHNHLFAAANTGVPHLLAQPAETIEVRRNFLQQAARLDIFGIREEGDIDGRLAAPLGARLPVLQPGRRYLIELVVRTRRIGHQLTQGTADSNELWLDLAVRDGARLIGRSGALGDDGDVDPWSYFVNSYLLDRTGRRIERRDAQNIFVALYDHQIAPGAATTVHYALTVPADASGPISVAAKLKYRKFDTRFLRHVKGADFVYNDLPVVTLAEDRVALPVVGGVVAKQSKAVDEWERWNDYGIGLLRKGKRELRQAEEAFSQVERIKPAHGALNLARVFYEEGRLSETADALERAEQAGAPPWTLAWYSALVEREFGNLDRAIEHLQNLVATRFNDAQRRGFDFAKDYRVLIQLGRSLFERARQERGSERATLRQHYLQQSQHWLEKALEIDPENAAAHYNLALVFSELDDPQRSDRHRMLHETYRTDDQAVELAVSSHRRSNPAADHAAEETAVYDLQRVGAFGLELPQRVAEVTTVVDQSGER